MDCKNTQDNFISFISEDLDHERLEYFLKHLEICPQCQEEFEIFYSLYRGMEILDNYSDEPFNVQKEIRDRLQEAKRQVIYYKRMRRAIFCCGMIVLVTGLYCMWYFMMEQPPQWIQNVFELFRR